MHAVSVITSIIVTTVHVSHHPCVSSFCKRTLVSLDLTPDLYDKRKTRQINERLTFINFINLKHISIPSFILKQ